jgi:hypothetical protein
VNVSYDPAPVSLPADEVYTNLTNIIISIDFDALEVFEATALIFEAGVPFYSNEQHNFLDVMFGAQRGKEDFDACS